MVVRIQKSRPSMKGTLDYNQKKVDRGVAAILGAYNITEGLDRDSLRRTFARYERGNIRTEKVSFQMNIDPDPDRPGEALTDDEALSYAKKLMDDLGYKDQPIVVYKHFDIERVHYHVVSIRVNEKGKKIRDSYEHENLQRLMARHAKEFHYIIGNQGVKEAEAERPIKPSMKDAVPRFDPKAGNVRGQIGDLFEEAMSYEFRNWYQFRLIMAGLGVKADFLETADGLKLTFQGLDADGMEAGGIISESEMGVPYYDLFIKRMKACSRAAFTKEEKAERNRDRHRTAYIFRKCIEYSRSELHLKRMLAGKGLALEISRTADGEPFGATVVEHSARRAYKLSELDRELTAILKETARPETGRWDLEAEIAKEEWIQQKRAERENAHIQRNMDLAAQQAGPMEPEGVSAGREDKTNWLAFAIMMLEALLTGRTTITRSITRTGRKKKVRKAIGQGQSFYKQKH